MSKAEPDLTLLTSCRDAVEAAALRSLLDAYGIACVVQGEQHSGMLGPMMGGAIIEVRVLVATKDLERARALLAAGEQAPEVQAAGLAAPAGAITEEAVCPVHGERSTATCGQCGTFLCERCGARGTPPLCEDCVDRQAGGSELRRKRRRKLVSWVLVGFSLGPFLVFLLALLLHRLLG